MDDKLTSLLRHLEAALRDCHDQGAHGSVMRALAMSGDERERFLVSNELWGGSGSIADQAGLMAGSREPGTRQIEQVLIELGEEQIRLGKVNVRTASWVEIFKTWKSEGI